MVKGKKEKPHLKAVGRVVLVSTSPQSKGHESLDSDDSLFDDNGDRDDHDDDSVFDKKEGGDTTGDEDGVPKDAEGGDVKEGKESGEQGGKAARILTIDEIRK